MKRITLFILLFFVVGVYQVSAQAYRDLIMNPNENTTLQEIKTLADEYFSTHPTGKGSGYKQYKRWEYKMERMVNADGKLQNFSRRNWDVIKKLNSDNPGVERSVMGNWSNLGPTSFTVGNSGYSGGLGRVNVIAFHPTDANTIYLGTPAGGVWKSTDGGGSWAPMSDMLASIGVSGIAVDHSSPNTVYILTGDGDGGDTQSIGVMKSTDGGASWAPTGLTWGITNFNRGYKLLMDPTNSMIMYAATSIGVLKTTDGWATWSNVQPGSFRDIEFKPGDVTTLYAVTTSTFYKTTNSGTTWVTTATGLPAGENRIALGVTPANANYVYYLAGPGGASGGGTYNGMYRSTDSGATFSTMSTTPNILGNSQTGSGTSDQSWYDLSLAVSPTNANTTISGGVNVWRSTDGGVNNTIEAHWVLNTPGLSYVHADIHDLVYNPVDNSLYCGSDGGISRSTDNGQNWTNIWNGLEIMQFYRIDGVEANPNLLTGGAQDNGSHKYTGTPVIEHSLGGDGMDNMIDYTDNNTMYMSFQNGGLQRSTNGAANFTGIQPGGSTGSWVTPYAMDATNPNIIYGGYNDVYRSTNQGTSWTNLGSDGRGAFAVGVNDPARLYAATGSTLQTSANTGGSWTTVSGSLPSLTITMIAVDPADANKVWVTFGGYTAGQKVYHSTNAGASWTNISGALPNAPALSIAHQNTGGAPADAIYVGMAVGVYYMSAVTPWTLHETGLPNVPIFDLEINHANNLIRAGTYGRGLWEAALFATAAPPNDLCDNAIPISCGSVTPGTTVDATADGAPFCGTSNTAPGVWYTWVGDGSCVSLTTCSPNTNYDTKLTVYTGSCLALTCVDGNDDDFSCPNSIFHSRVEFASVAGTTYRILVHGFSSGVGNFELTMTCTPVPPLVVTCPPNQNLPCGTPVPAAATTEAEFIAQGGTITGGSCDNSGYTVTSTDMTVGDQCSGIEVTREYTVTSNNSGASEMCTQMIIIDSPDPPVVTCPADITVACEDEIMLDPNNATVVTDCNLGFAVYIKNPIGTGVPGCDGTIYEYIYKAVDDCGNVGQCSQFVTIVNNPPTVTAPAGGFVDCYESIDVDASNAVVTGACADYELYLTAPEVNGAVGCPGTTYTFTYRLVEACGRVVEDTQVFTENPNPAPVIDAPANTTCTCIGGITPNPNNAVVTTSCNTGYNVVVTGPVQSGAMNCPNTTYTYTYTVTDDCGRVASDQQVYTIVNDGPTFQDCPGSNWLHLNCEDYGGEAGAIAVIEAWIASVTAYDACGQQLTVSTDFNSNNINTCINNGINEVEFKATDGCNRTSFCYGTYVIVDTEAPEFTEDPQDHWEVCNYNSQANLNAWVAAHGGATAWDGCQGGNVNWTVSPGNPQINCMGAMGTTSVTVTFIATDNCGNKDSRTATFNALMGNSDFHGDDISTTKDEDNGNTENSSDIDLENEIDLSTIPEDKLTLFQNRPNPFKNETLIIFYLPEATFATLNIYDISGRVVKTIEGNYNKGLNEVSISRSDLSGAGVMYYSLKTQNDYAGKIMLLID